jgi:hypothetical protein
MQLGRRAREGSDYRVSIFCPGWCDPGLRFALEPIQAMPRGSTGSPAPLLLEVEHGLVTQFRVEAARRDMPVKRLLHDLLDTIASDHLTGAILDRDGDPPEA